MGYTSQELHFTALLHRRPAAARPIPMHTTMHNVAGPPGETEEMKAVASQTKEQQQQQQNCFFGGIVGFYRT